MRVSCVFSFARIVACLTFAVAGGPAAAQTAVKFTLDWKFEGPAAPFLVAIDRGHFTAEGLDVSIDTGNGSVEPINRVASGNYDIGFGDINTLIKFRDQNPANNIKAVFMVYNKPPFAIVTRKSRGIREPKDLEGKKLGAPAGDGTFAQWPIFVHANGIDASKVTVENVGFPVREPMLAAGQVDAIEDGHIAREGGEGARADFHLARAHQTDDLIAGEVAFGMGGEAYLDAAA